MQNKIWGAALTIFLLASPPAASQQALHCRGLDPAKPGHATRAYECVSKLSADLEAALARMEALEATAHPIPEIPRIPKGAVVAFADDSCPPGWSRYTKALGRMIIGATENAEFIAEYSKGSDGKQLPSKKFSEHGGQPTVTLTRAQMPGHQHELDMDQRPGSPGYKDGGNFPGAIIFGVQRGPGSDETLRNTGTVVDHQGMAAPHPNMPPYIALYFCKKD